VIGLIFISSYFLIWPKVRAIGEISASIKKKEERLARLTEKLSSLKGLNERELMERSELVLEILPESKKPMLVMGVLKQLAFESDVEIRKINVRPGEVATGSAGKAKKEKVPSLTFSLRLIGSFDEIDQFVRRLEKSIPLTRLEKISFKKTGTGEYSTALVEILSYYLSLPEVLGKIDTPIKLITEEERKIYDRLRQFDSPSLLAPDQPFLPPIESGRANPFI
jgi:hypothetical protein